MAASAGQTWLGYSRIRWLQHRACVRLTRAVIKCGCVSGGVFGAGRTARTHAAGRGGSGIQTVAHRTDSGPLPVYTACVIQYQTSKTYLSKVGNSPAYLWRVGQWTASFTRKAAKNVQPAVYQPSWNCPGWPNGIGVYMHRRVTV